MIHPLDRILDAGQESLQADTDVASVLRYVALQAWSAGWDAGLRHGKSERAIKSRDAKVTERVKAEIEASRRRFADLAERVIDGKGGAA